MHNNQQQNGLQGVQSNGNLINQSPYSSRFNQASQQNALGLLRSPTNQLSASQSNSRNQFQQAQQPLNNDVS